MKDPNAVVPNIKQSNIGVLNFVEPDLGYRFVYIIEEMIDTVYFDPDDLACHNYLVNFFSYYSLPRIDIVEDQGEQFSVISSSTLSSINIKFSSIVDFDYAFNVYRNFIEKMVTSAELGDDEAKYKLFKSAHTHYEYDPCCDVKVRTHNTNLNYLKNSGYIFSPDIEHAKNFMAQDADDDPDNDQIFNLAKDYMDSVAFAKELCDGVALVQKKPDMDSLIELTIASAKVKLSAKRYVNSTLFNNLFRGFARTEEHFRSISEHIPMYSRFIKFASMLSLLGCEFNTFSQGSFLFTDKELLEKMTTDKFFLDRFKPLYSKYKKREDIDINFATLFNSALLNAEGKAVYQFRTGRGEDGREEMDFIGIENPSDFLGMINRLYDIRCGNAPLTAHDEECIESFRPTLTRYFKAYDAIFNNPEMNGFQLDPEDRACLLLKSQSRYRISQIVAFAISIGMVEPNQVVDQALFNKLCRQVYDIDLSTHLYKFAFYLKLFFNTEISDIDASFYTKDIEEAFKRNEAVKGMLELIGQGYKLIDSAYLVGENNGIRDRPHGNFQPFKFVLKIHGDGSFIRLEDLPARFTNEGFSLMFKESFDLDETVEGAYAGDTNFVLELVKRVGIAVELGLFGTKQRDYENFPKIMDVCTENINKKTQNNLKTAISSNDNNDDIIKKLDKMLELPIDESAYIVDLFMNMTNVRSLAYYSEPKIKAKTANDIASLHSYLDCDEDINAVMSLIEIFRGDNDILETILGVGALNDLRSPINPDSLAMKKSELNKSTRRPD